ncbi:Uncharacterized protein OBRU01_17462, partial [Operophtera brumata]
MQRADDDISCHYKEYNWDLLPSAENASFSPPPDSIFFHDTSCRGALNSRHACAVESAAKTHPGRQIYVLFSGPVLIWPFIDSSYPNIHFARVHIDEYAKDTVLEDLFSKRTHDTSKEWKVVHTSDLLRLITLFKFGGLYLDLDMVVVKPLDHLGRNWVARENGSNINNAVMNVAKDDLGKKFIGMVLNEVSSTYEPDLWQHNGPGALNRVLSEFCNTTSSENFCKATCQGFEVYGLALFYPIRWTDAMRYLDPGEITDTPYTYHVWSDVTDGFRVLNTSLYAKLAE